MEKVNALIQQLRGDLALLPTCYADLPDQQLVLLTSVYKALVTMGRCYDSLLQELTACGPDNSMELYYDKVKTLEKELQKRIKSHRTAAERAPLLHALMQMHQYVYNLPSADLNWLFNSISSVETRFAEGRLKGPVYDCLDLLLDDAFMIDDFEHNVPSLFACLNSYLTQWLDDYQQDAWKSLPIDQVVRRTALCAIYFINYSNHPQLSAQAEQMLQSSINLHLPLFTPIHIAVLRDTHYDINHLNYLQNILPQLHTLITPAPGIDLPSRCLHLLLQIDHLELALLTLYQ